jgi:hypothetical protein
LDQSGFDDFSRSDHVGVGHNHRLQSSGLEVVSSTCPYLKLDILGDSVDLGGLDRDNVTTSFVTSSVSALEVELILRIRESNVDSLIKFLRLEVRLSLAIGTSELDHNISPFTSSKSYSTSWVNHGLTHIKVLSRGVKITRTVTFENEFIVFLVSTVLDNKGIWLGSLRELSIGFLVLVSSVLGIVGSDLDVDLLFEDLGLVLNGGLTNGLVV